MFNIGNVLVIFAICIGKIKVFDDCVCPDMSFPYSDFVITQLFMLVTKMSHQLNDNDVD